jgi:hypothetical protein
VNEEAPEQVTEWLLKFFSSEFKPA